MAMCRAAPSFRTGRCRFDLVVSTDKAVRCTSIECDDVEDCRRWVRLFAGAAGKLRGKVDIYLEPPKKDRKAIEVLEASDPLRAQLVTKKAGVSNMSKAKNCHALRQMLSTGDLSRDDEETVYLAPQYLFACSLFIPANLDKNDSHYYATISSRELLPGAEWKQQGHSEVEKRGRLCCLDSLFVSSIFLVWFSSYDDIQFRCCEVCLQVQIQSTLCCPFGCSYLPLTTAAPGPCEECNRRWQARSPRKRWTHPRSTASSKHCPRAIVAWTMQCSTGRNMESFLQFFFLIINEGCETFCVLFIVKLQHAGF